MKQKMVVNGEIPFLPQEVITSILKRLPVKSLIRFQCVCKDWRDLFKTPFFIEEHLRHSRKNPNLLFEAFSPSYYLLSSFLDHDMKKSVDFHSSPLIDSSLGARIVDSCNGLICVQTLYEPMILWNPSIREAIQVPEGIKSFEAWTSHVGFGFSSMVNDYKIVIIPSSYIKKVKVYSLSTGAWKDVKVGNLDGVSLESNGFIRKRHKNGVALCSESYSITSNGAIFWFGSENDGKKDSERYNFLVSFDLALEVFTLIPFPSSIPKEGMDKLVVYQNKLAMLCHRVIGNNKSSIIDLWVMEGGDGASGESWSWTKIYSTSPHPCLLIPGVIWNNEIVCDFVVTGPELKDGYKPKIVLFNLSTHGFKMVDRIYGHSDPIFNYVESLVSVHSNHIQEP